jgi:hypothetical protein
MFRDPFGESSAENAGEVNEGRRKQCSFTKLFSEKTGKRIDEVKCECSLGNLSPSGERFFEIYFVRLIGTPNQHIPS